VRVLLVGGGGREHAMAWKLTQSPLLKKLYCAPGNAGTGLTPLSENVPIAATDIDALVAWAKDNAIDLVAVASDDPLALGLVDACQAAGLRAFGPAKAAAEIEWSKVFAKGLMRKYNIPTAAYETFTDCAAAAVYAKAQNPSPERPLVIKADGLALGKGVVIVRDAAEAEAVLRDMMEGGSFAGAGRRVVIEEYLRGREVTAMCFTDGGTVFPMPPARDHKRAYDNDEGPNTGGMGAITPVPDYTPELAARCAEEIMRPAVNAMRAEGRLFKGILYCELMLTADGPKVIEFNARFGDPEAQALLPLLESDLLEIMLAVEAGRLDTITPQWEDAACACVVAASGGYPGDYRKELPITGLDALPKDILVFHAGTIAGASGRLVTNGGRVLAVCAKGDTPGKALGRVYGAIDRIHFEGMFYRRDIGALKPL
jgi:phosphoribosylamine--glycine ligase